MRVEMTSQWLVAAERAGQVPNHKPHDGYQASAVLREGGFLLAEVYPRTVT